MVEGPNFVCFEVPAKSVEIDGRPKRLNESGCFVHYAVGGRHRLSAVTGKGTQRTIDLYPRRGDESVVLLVGERTVRGSLHYVVVQGPGSTVRL